MTTSAPRPDLDHIPTPFSEGAGGGVRCSCGWVERTHGSRGRSAVTIAQVWEHFRGHWAESRPDPPTEVPAPAPVTQDALFDPGPYTR
jgi:hypothetical protein